MRVMIYVFTDISIYCRMLEASCVHFYHLLATCSSGIHKHLRFPTMLLVIEWLWGLIDAKRERIA